MRKLTLIVALALAAPALAQDQNHSGHVVTTEDPVVEAWIAANAKMHEGMAIEFSGNADVDFVRGMIAHHQGAIDMARIVLEHGSDPEIRKLAEEIITAQEGEIAWMEQWLKDHAE